MLNKYVIYGIIIAIIIAMIGITYVAWEAKIKQQALIEYNQTQIQQVIKDKAELEKKLNNVKNLADDVSKKLNDKVDALNNKTADLEAYLNSKETKSQDKPTSNIIKRTLEELNGSIK
jgi:peptidoglycan hydrolase CwlO-like protein